MTLHPLDNTALCLTRIGAEAVGAGLRLARCGGLMSQQFIGIQIGHTVLPAWAMLLSPDARYCVATIGKVPNRKPVLTRCTGASKDEWYADLNLTTAVSYQFDDLYLGDPSKGPADDAMDAPNFGRAGTKIVLHLEQGNLDSPAQLWTDLAPGASTGGNADGSFGIRPLYNLRLCLTVPRADDTAGVQLQVQACDGKSDQEFSRSPSPISPPGDISDQTLSPFTDGSLCVGVNGTIAEGKPVKLLPCRDTASQNWTNQSGWFGWAS